VWLGLWRVGRAGSDKSGQEGVGLGSRGGRVSRGEAGGDEHGKSDKSRDGAAWDGMSGRGRADGGRADGSGERWVGEARVVGTGAARTERGPDCRERFAEGLCRAESSK